MRDFISRITLFVVGIVINILLGFASDFLIEKYDGLGMFLSVVICVIYLVIMIKIIYDKFIDKCFFDKVLKCYLLIIMPIMTNLLLFMAGS